MRLKDAFGTFHPGVTFLMFVIAMVFGMCLRHPVFMVLSIVASAAYFLTIKGVAGLRYIAAMIPVFLVVTAINPLFNTYGDTVLFTYFSGRPYTLEALGYGTITASMLVTILLWFASYNQVMTSDKFTYLFGSVMPSLSLVLTMVLRMVPNFRKKAQQLSTARQGLGKTPSEGSSSEKVEHGMQLLSALTSWALENSVVVADSMRSRGYGVGRRSSFANFRFQVRDGVLLILMLACTVVTAAVAVSGALYANFVPSVDIAGPTPLVALAFVSYAVLLFIPTFVNIRESLTWRISLSRI